jgi:hypothetical protein
MRHFALLSALLLQGCGAQAGNYLIEPAGDFIAPTATATPTKKEARALPRLTPTATPQKLLLAPFRDKRRLPTIYQGRIDYDKVSVDPSGRTTLAKSWQELRDGDLSYLWHRSLARSLAAAGYNVSAAAEPMDDAAALEAAKSAGAQFVLQGEINRMIIDKRGADSFLGTNLSGTDYNFKSKTTLRLRRVVDGSKAVETPVAFEHSFHNKTMLGASDRDTFPIYFIQGLPLAGREVADSSPLREAVGLPTCTPTPTDTPTPDPKKVTPQPTATAGPQGPTPTPTPDTEPYWYNPHTGKRVDPKWNFDPADGTPKKEFILKSR